MLLSEVKQIQKEILLDRLHAAFSPRNIISQERVFEQVAAKWNKKLEATNG